MKVTRLSLSSIDRHHILDAIEDALREIDEEPCASAISQRVVDKLLSSKEILDEKDTSNT